MMNPNGEFLSTSSRQGRAKRPLLPPAMGRTIRSVAASITLLLLAALLASCTIRDIVIYVFGPNHVMENMKPEFSYNILEPPWWWPDEDAFKAANRRQGQTQREYYEQYGKPDYLRLWFNAQGTVLPRDVVWSRKALPEPKGVSWIYLDRNIEVTFAGAQALEKPLNDEVATHCQLGDPDEIKLLNADSDVRSVRYVYRRDGLLIDFVDFKKVNVRRERELPGWIRS